MDGLTQLRAGSPLRFQAIDAAEAIQQVRSYAQLKSQFLRGINQARGTLQDRLMRENLISGMLCAANLTDPA